MACAACATACEADGTVPGGERGLVGAPVRAAAHVPFGPPPPSSLTQASPVWMVPAMLVRRAAPAPPRRACGTAETTATMTTTPTTTTPTTTTPTTTTPTTTTPNVPSATTVRKKRGLRQTCPAACPCAGCADNRSHGSRRRADPDTDTDADDDELAQARASGDPDTAAPSDFMANQFADQNMCVLRASVPPELADLPYGVYPTDPRYPRLRFLFNKRFNAFPRAIFTPRNDTETAHVLRGLVRSGVPFALRSGGHCCEPGSLPSPSDGCIIDMREYNAIEPDLRAEVVRVGAGCLIGDVMNALAPLGRFVVTGDCPAVGIAGLVLNGGHGPVARACGLACDNLVSVSLMVADCSVIEVNARTYPDLFWALCGAGNGSFGIALRLTLRMYPTSGGATFTAYQWRERGAHAASGVGHPCGCAGGVGTDAPHDDEHPAAAAARPHGSQGACGARAPCMVGAILHRWQSWALADDDPLPRSITPHLRLRYDAATCAATATISMLELHGSAHAMRPVATPAIAGMRADSAQRYSGSFYAVAPRWTETHTAPFSKCKSAMMVQRIPPEGVAVVQAFIADARAARKPYDVYFTFAGLGGAVRDGRNAFWPRDALCTWHMMLSWDDQKHEARALADLHAFADAMAPFLEPGWCYANVPDYSLGDEYMWRFYGMHARPLMEIKARWDPDDVFRWRQSIPLPPPLHQRARERRRAARRQRPARCAKRS